MTFLIADTYYPAMLNAFHRAHPNLDAADYATMQRALMAEAFGTSDFYSRNLRAMGHEAIDVVANDRRLQGKWTAEHGGPKAGLSWPSAALRKVPYARRLVRDSQWVLPILEAQIRAMRPDVLYLLDLNLCEPSFVQTIRPYVKLIVGQIAAPLPDARFLEGFDLILTSFPHFVDRFRAMGVPSEYFRIGFEATVLERLTLQAGAYGAVFVGGFENVHAPGTQALERLAREVTLDTWGYGVESLDPASPILERFHGQAWGIDMYNIFHNAKIVVNRHSSASEGYANNMRLYEATGAGALLITDRKKNLGEIFEVGAEVIAYDGPDDLIDKVRYYLAHETERATIATAGQVRTLRDHTYAVRMQELEAIIEAHLDCPPRTGKGPRSRSGS
jgi:spore maturation protein CgeB